MSFSANITSDSATILEVANEADEIHKEIQLFWSNNQPTVRTEPTMSKQMTSLSDKLMGLLKADHPKFYAAYALIMIYMIRGCYTSDTFRKYLDYIRRKPWTSDEEYMFAASKYVAWTMVARHPAGNKGRGWKRRDIKDLRDSLYKTMLEESNRVKSTGEKLKEYIKTEEDQNAADFFNSLSTGELQASSKVFQAELAKELSQ